MCDYTRLKEYCTLWGMYVLTKACQHIVIRPSPSEQQTPTNGPTGIFSAIRPSSHSTVHLRPSSSSDSSLECTHSVLNKFKTTAHHTHTQTHSQKHIHTHTLIDKAMTTTTGTQKKANAMPFQRGRCA